MSRKKNQNKSYVTTPLLQEEFKPLTRGHAEYIKVMAENVITFVTGPAGSSKSYSALALASQYLLDGKVDKILIARPTIEASPRGIGFIKGSIDEKMAPWLLPATEHLQRFLGKDMYYRMYHEGRIEGAPLEYMRGRTLDYTFAILEEAQNCTTEQIKMVCTRIGKDSKIVINGDVEQTDLRKVNNTIDLEYVISLVEKHQPNDVGVAYLGENDIVRHPIIGKFLQIFK